MDLKFEVVIPSECRAVELDRIVRRIRKLYAVLFPSSTDEMIRGRLLRTPDARVDLVSDGGRDVAWGICIPVALGGGETCLFRHGTVIEESHQSVGLYKRLLQIGIERHRPSWHAAKTQNTRCYEAWKKMHPNGLFPDPERGPTKLEIGIAEKIVRDTTFNTDTFVVRNVFRENQLPIGSEGCRSDSVRRFFAESIGIHDGFILLAKCQG